MVYICGSENDSKIILKYVIIELYYDKEVLILIDI